MKNRHLLVFGVLYTVLAASNVVANQQIDIRLEVVDLGISHPAFAYYLENLRTEEIDSTKLEVELVWLPEFFETYDPHILVDDVLTLTLQGREYSAPDNTLAYLGHTWGVASLNASDFLELGVASIDVTLFADDNSSFVGRIAFLFNAELSDEVIITGVLIEDHGPRISALESWKEGVDALIDAIETQLEEVKQWLFFWDYQGGGESVCDAVAECDQAPSVIICTSDWDCGISNWTGEPSCHENRFIVQDFEEFVCVSPGKPSSYCDTNVYAAAWKYTCPKKCLNGACVECLTAADCTAGWYCTNNVCVETGPPTVEQECSFRTNVEKGDYYNSWDYGWIAYDFDGDGALDGLGISGRGSWSSSRCSEEPLLLTPTGDRLIDYGHSSRLLICDELTHQVVYFELGDASADDAELSSEPAEPFTTNEQEVCGPAPQPPQAPHIECHEDDDCGTDGWVGDPMCAGDDVWQDYKVYTCHNPGTEDAYCSDDTAPQQKTDCPTLCVNSACLDCVYAYAEDFSSDPGWTTNNLSRFYRDPATDTFYALTVERADEYATIPIGWSGDSFLLTFDVMIASSQWASGAHIGLFDSDRHFGQPDVVEATYAHSDDGLHLNLQAYNSGGSAGAPSYVQNVYHNVWYHNNLMWDNETGVITLAVTERETGNLVGTYTVDGFYSFSEDMINLGVAWVGHTASNHETLSYIDNVFFCEQG